MGLSLKKIMEIEVRAKINSPDIIREKLSELGAKKTKERKQLDKYFSSMELCEKLDYSFLLRIRKSGKEYSVNVKTNKQKTDGIWEEYETPIENPEVFEEMFQAMGLERVIEVAKNRESFRLGDINLNIDTFEDRGSFLEFEIISEDKEAKEKLFHLAEGLGINKDKIIEKGYISTFLKEMGSPFSKYIKN
ncbi:MAG: class IV adenylate cyclase [Candidatus Nealsonbacteria bacterium]|nr:class IV adenylate cyclase [Candidatus Nealsonbacteria bacterium]